ACRRLRRRVPAWAAIAFIDRGGATAGSGVQLLGGGHPPAVRAPVPAPGSEERRGQGRAARPDGRTQPRGLRPDLLRLSYGAEPGLLPHAIPGPIDRYHRALREKG